MSRGGAAGLLGNGAVFHSNCYLALDGLTDSRDGAGAWACTMDDMGSGRAAALVDGGAEIWTQGIAPPLDFARPIWGYPPYYPVLIFVEGEGTVTVNDKNALYLTGDGTETVKVSITPDEGFRVKKARIEYSTGAAAAIGNGYTFTMPKAAVTITVSFYQPSNGDGDGDGGGTGGGAGDGTGTGAGDSDEDGDSEIGGSGEVVEFNLKSLVVQAWRVWSGSSSTHSFEDWLEASHDVLDEMIRTAINITVGTGTLNGEEAAAEVKQAIESLNSRTGVSASDSAAMQNALKKYLENGSDMPFIQWLTSEESGMDPADADKILSIYTAGLDYLAGSLYAQYAESGSELTFPEWLDTIDVDAAQMVPSEDGETEKPDEAQTQVPQEIPDGVDSEAGGGGGMSVFQVVAQVVRENPLLVMLLLAVLLIILVLAGAKRYRQSKKDQ